MRDLYGHFEIRVDDDDVTNAGGDFQQAVQNVVGHTGMIVDEVTDENDCPTQECADE